MTNTTEINEVIQLVGFKLGDEDFAVDISRVQEINRMLKITKVPNSQEFVEGVVNLRGKIVPVVNLRERLGFPQKEEDAKTKIIVTEINNSLIGFIVDEVREVIRISKDIIEQTPTIASSIEKDLINGVAKLEDRILILLNIENLFQLQEEINQ
jgi:purine-binding chemotaxis protein CheW